MNNPRLVFNDNFAELGGWQYIRVPPGETLVIEASPKFIYDDPIVYVQFGSTELVSYSRRFSIVA